jgi:hypothetical protein
MLFSAAEALAVLGAGYFTIIMGSALAIKKPHSSFVPDGFDPAAAGAVGAKVVDVSMPEAIRYQDASIASHEGC